MTFLLFLGDSFSYCANPTGLKTDWCPTALKDDGSYTADMGFAWCTPGPVYEACKAAKAANTAHAQGEG